MKQKGSIHLLPNLIAESDVDQVIPRDLQSFMCGLRHFMVENVRNARRYLKKIDRTVDIDSIQFYEMGKHASPQELEVALNAVRQGHPLGVISDAGCPGVADP
ncbi:MAG: SAM-dependent methyltransferase, partial [Flavobacteriales bacterium]|nr:SAM-dependent methyltransferase [Flavobacteriales bacterium]